MINQEIVYSDGGAYNKFMGVWSRIVGSKFLDWLSPEADQKWIDIGCGTGAFTEQILKVCEPHEVHGVDPLRRSYHLLKVRSRWREHIFRL